MPDRPFAVTHYLRRRTAPSVDGRATYSPRGRAATVLRICPLLGGCRIAFMWAIARTMPTRA